MEGNVFQLLNKIIRCFVKCARFRANTSVQLPTERITAYKPFTYTGLDYNGSYHIFESKGRNIKFSKIYICLLPCLCSKAIHLEVVSDYKSSSRHGQ